MERRKKRGDGQREKLTIYQLFFEIELVLVERFTALSPFQVRREKSGEVFKLLKRLGEHIQREEDKNGKIVEINGRKVIWKKAGDDWF